MRDALQAGLQGLGLGLAVALALLWSTQSMLWAVDSAQTRSLAMLTLVMGNTALILIGCGRSWRRWHPVAWSLGAGSLALLLALMHWPWSAAALGLAPLPALAWMLAAACSIACVAGVQAVTAARCAPSA